MDGAPLPTAQEIEQGAAVANLIQAAVLVGNSMKVLVHPETQESRVFIDPVAADALDGALKRLQGLLSEMGMAPVPPLELEESTDPMDRFRRLSVIDA